MLFYLLCLIFLILWAFLGCYIAQEDDDIGIGVVMGLFVSFLTSSFIILVLFLPLGLHYSEKIVTDSSQYHQDIVSLRDNSSLSGEFFLGYGKIGTDNCYIYYHKVDNNQFIQRSISTSNVTIVETNEQTPKLQWNNYYYKTPNWLMPDWWTNDEHSENLKLIVPKGTIIKQFKVE